MSDEDLIRIADDADLIVNGYAYTKMQSGGMRVLNLNNPARAAVLNDSGNFLETTMDDIELGIVLDYYRSNRAFVEA